MADLPESTLSIQDGALGLTPPNPTRVQSKVGVCSAGPINTPTPIASTTALKAIFGTGPLVEATGHVLDVAGGPIIVCRAETTSPGSQSAVSKTGTGLSVLTVGGTALDAYEVQVKMTAGGANPAAGTAAFVYSLDGGRNWSPPFSVPVAGAFDVKGTGLSLTFSAATLVSGDVYSFTCTPPSASLTDIMEAVAAIKDRVMLVHVVGVGADLTAAVALFGALDTHMASEENKFRYTFAAMELGEHTDAAIKTAFAGLVSASKRVAISAGHARINSAIVRGNAYKRPVMWTATARAGQVPPGQKVSDVGFGALVGVTALYRNEEETPGLHQLNFVTARTYSGRNGFFISGDRLFTDPTSDFQTWTARRVADIASYVIRSGTLPYVESRIRVNKTSGFILEQDARSIDDRLERLLRDALKDDISDLEVKVRRDENILSTSELNVDYRIIPLAYASHVRNFLGFKNPVLAAV